MKQDTFFSILLNHFLLLDYTDKVATMAAVAASSLKDLTPEDKKQIFGLAGNAMYGAGIIVVLIILLIAYAAGGPLTIGLFVLFGSLYLGSKMYTEHQVAMAQKLA